MPRSGSGTYSLPDGTLVNTGDTILVSQHNPAMLDIANAISNSLDRDGTGGMRTALNMGSNKITNVTPGTNPTDAATVSQLTTGSFPAGSVIDYAGQTPPTGWLLCGGQSVSRTDYAALFAVLGTTYGSVDGSSFNVPDLRGRVTAGRDFTVAGSTSNRLTNTTMTPSAGVLAGAGGAQTHTLTEAQMPSHTHAVTGSTNEAGLHNHEYTLSLPGASGGGSDTGGNSTQGLTNAAGAHSHTISVSAANTGGGQAHPIVQPTFILNKIIKV